MRRISIAPLAFLATAFLTGGHCGNEVTAPNATPTAVPTPVPTAVPVGQPASLHGAVTGFNGASPPVVVVHAAVKVTQLSGTKVGETNSLGQYEIDGLQSGPANVEVSGGNYQPTFQSIVLLPGSNAFGVELHP
jgi:hypothetical protein